MIGKTFRIVAWFSTAILLGVCAVAFANRHEDRSVLTCQAVAPAQAAADALLIGIAPELSSEVAPSICRIVVSSRVAVVSYDLNQVDLPPLAVTGPDPRLPMPLILVDGRDAGRLPTHVPAELPLTIRLSAHLGGTAELPVLCLRAETAALGDPPTYEPIVYRDGGYQNMPSDTSCN